MKELLIHCGLHKTGTTALQNFLTLNREALAGAGVLYPRAGTPPGLTGQHNIAWEMARDRRYRSALGNLDQLFAEMAGHPGRVIVSSEEFESSLLHPERWSRWVARAQGVGFSVRLVVYLREISAHLQSVYLQKLRSGYGQEFQLAARLALETGYLRWNDGQICLSRPAIERALAAVKGAEVTYRHYETMKDRSTVSDFCEAFELDGIAWKNPDVGRPNERDPLALSLLRFLLARQPPAHENRQEFEIFIRGLFGNQPTVLAVPEKLRHVLAGRLTPDAPGSEAAPAAGPPTVNMARVFSFETQVTLIDAFELGGRPGGAARRDALVAQWRQWIADLS